MELNKTGLESPAQYIETPSRSILNPVKTMMPFKWTINPYRGCRHACVYCFARPTHTFYGLNAGTDFHSTIFVKINAPALLRKEISRPTWKGEHICMGSVTDPYQPAERRYRLSRQLLEILCEVANPLSIITKSHLILDDLELLVELNRRTEGQLSVNMSLITLDEAKARLIDPAAPAPAKRLEALERLSAAGIKTRLFIMPVLPGITDQPEDLEDLVREAARIGVTGVATDPLRIARGLESYYFEFIDRYFPALRPRYNRLYAHGQRTTVDKRYHEALKRKFEELKIRYNLSGRDTLTGRAFEEPARLEAALREAEEAEETENANHLFANPNRRTRPKRIPPEREKQTSFGLE